MPSSGALGQEAPSDLRPPPPAPASTRPESPSLTDRRPQSLATPGSPDVTGGPDVPGLRGVTGTGPGHTRTAPRRRTAREGKHPRAPERASGAPAAAPTSGPLSRLMPPLHRIMTPHGLGQLLRQIHEAMRVRGTPLHPAEIQGLAHLMSRAQGTLDEDTIGLIGPSTQLIPPCPQARALWTAIATLLRTFNGELSSTTIGKASLVLRSLDSSPEAMNLVEVMTGLLAASSRTQLDERSAATVCFSLQSLADHRTTRQLVATITGMLKRSAGLQLGPESFSSACCGLQSMGNTEEARGLADVLMQCLDERQGTLPPEKLSLALAGTEPFLADTPLGQWLYRLLVGYAQKVHLLSDYQIRRMVNDMALAGAYDRVPPAIVSRYRKLAVEANSQQALHHANEHAVREKLVEALRQPGRSSPPDLRFGQWCYGISMFALLGGRRPVNFEVDGMLDGISPRPRMDRLRDQCLRAQGIEVVRLPATGQPFDAASTAKRLLDAITPHLQAAAAGQGSGSGSGPASAGQGSAPAVASPPAAHPLEGKWRSPPDPDQGPGPVPPSPARVTVAPSARTAPLQVPAQRIHPDLHRLLAACHTLPDLIRALDQHCARRVGRPSAIEVAAVIGRVGQILQPASRSGHAPAIEEFDLDYLAALLTLAPGEFDEEAIAQACAGLRDLPRADATARLWGLLARLIEGFKGPLSATTIVIALDALQCLKGHKGAQGGRSGKALVMALAGKIRISRQVQLNGAQVAVACGGLAGLSHSAETQALAEALAGLIEASRRVTFTRDEVLLACSGLRHMGPSGEPLALVLAPVLFASNTEPLDERSQSSALGCLHGLNHSLGSAQMTKAIRKMALSRPVVPPDPSGGTVWVAAGPSPVDLASQPAWVVGTTAYAPAPPFAPVYAPAPMHQEMGWHGQPGGWEPVFATAPDTPWPTQGAWIPLVPAAVASAAPAPGSTAPSE